MVWGAEDEKSGDITIVVAIIPDADEVAEAIGKDADDEQIKALLWKEVDKINANLPMFKKIKKISLRHEEFEKNTSKKIKRFVESNKKM